MEISDLAARFDCCEFSDRQFKDLVLKLLLSISGGGGAGSHTLSNGVTATTPVGAYSVTVYVSAGSVTINGLVITSGNSITLTANNGRVLPAITITDNGGAAWVWSAIV